MRSRFDFFLSSALLCNAQMAAEGDCTVDARRKRTINARRLCVLVRNIGKWLLSWMRRDILIEMNSYNVPSVKCDTDKCGFARLGVARTFYIVRQAMEEFCLPNKSTISTIRMAFVLSAVSMAAHTRKRRTSAGDSRAAATSS